MYNGDSDILVVIDPAKHAFQQHEKVIVINWYNQRKPYNSGVECLPYSPELELDMGGAAKMLSKPGDAIKRINIGVYHVKKVRGNIMYVA